MCPHVCNFHNSHTLELIRNDSLLSCIYLVVPYQLKILAVWYVISTDMMYIVHCVFEGGRPPVLKYWVGAVTPWPLSPQFLFHWSVDDHRVA